MSHNGINQYLSNLVYLYICPVLSALEEVLELNRVKPIQAFESLLSHFVDLIERDQCGEPERGERVDNRRLRSVSPSGHLSALFLQT